MSKTKKHRHKWEYDSDGRTYPFICQCGNVLDNGQIERILNGPKYVRLGRLKAIRLTRWNAICDNNEVLYIRKVKKVSK